MAVAVGTKVAVGAGVAVAGTTILVTKLQASMEAVNNRKAMRLRVMEKHL